MGSSRQNWWRLDAMAFVAVLLVATLFLVRFFLSVPLDQPALNMTSGAEEEGLFVFWKVLNGEPVYSDRFTFPYWASYYNAFYYYMYAWLDGAVMALFGVDEAWLPNLSRLVTVTFLFIGATTAAILFRIVAAPAAPSWQRQLDLLSVFLFFGPLVGFFGMAAVPDPGAFTFEVLAGLSFLLLIGRRPMSAVIALMVFAMAAWGFKQIYVFSVGAAGVTLLARREWRALAVLCVAMPLAWTVAVLSGGADYAQHLFHLSTDKTFVTDLGLRNLANAVVKLTPLAGLAAAAVILAWRARQPWPVRNADPATLYALAGLVLSTVMTVPASFRFGAAENYYFPITFYAALTTAVLLGHAGRVGVSVRRPERVLVGVGWLLSAVSIIAVLAGYAGVLRAENHFTGDTKAYHQCVEAQPKPLFVAGYDSKSRFASLPWITPRDMPLMPPYLYRRDRAQGHTFENNGFGGLIEKGYFATILALDSVQHFDGGGFHAYKDTGFRCGEFRVLHRISGQGFSLR